MKCLAVVNLSDADVLRHSGSIAGFVSRNLTGENSFKLVCFSQSADGDASAENSELLDAIASDVPAAEIVIVSAGMCFPQTAATYIAELQDDFDLVITPGTDFGNALAVHAAAMLSGTALTGAVSAELRDDCCICTKKIYAGHVLGKYQLDRKPYVLSVDKTIPPGRMEQRLHSEPAIVRASMEDTLRMKVLEMDTAEAGSDLDEADCVVICGRGAGSRENTEKIAELAASLGMVSAGSRPCVMNAWMPMSRMIGVSGKMIHPELAILLGISGAPAFYEGIRSSKHIIAVNNDPDAPASHKSDLFIHGDCMEVFGSFAEILKEDGEIPEQGDDKQ